MAPASLHCRADAEIAHGARESEKALRRASRRQISHRGRGPAQESPPRQGRPDRRHPDTGAPAAITDAQDHRRPLGHRARARRTTTEKGHFMTEPVIDLLEAEELRKAI